MATRSLNVQITGNARDLGVASKQAERHISGVEAAGTRMGRNLSLGFAAAGAAAGGALVAGLKSSVQAAMEAEKSQARLKAQLDASGISYRAHAKEIEAVIQKHSRLAGIDDEELQDAFTNIVRVTGNVTQSMKLVGLAADIARAKHMDVAKAGELVGKVAGGNTGILARYGFVIKEGATATEALGQLQKKFAGQAAAYGKTAAGAQDRFRVATENLQEKIGQKLLPTLTRATNSVAKFANQMDDGTGSGGKFAKSIGDLTDELSPYVKATTSAVAWTKRHESVWRGLTAALPNPMNGLRSLTVILKSIATAAGAVVTAVKGVGTALGWVGDKIPSFGGILGKTGDGLGRMAQDLRGFGGSGGAFTGGLMGARPSMAPFAAIGASHGLHVSSGKRPGSITSSGNVSWHSSGEAVDLAGPPGAMLSTFRDLKSRFGGRLAELIHTPGGAGIKNGSPYTYGGQVARDHFDHVHVAFDSGRPGVGDGPGRLSNGPKPPMSHNQVAALAESVGLPGETFAQLAKGESGYDPDNVGHDPGGTLGLGLWQITTKYNDDLIAKYGGRTAMFDPMKNALAARDIWRRQGKSAWYGSKFVKGWDLHYKGSLKGVVKGGGGGSKGTTKTAGSPSSSSRANDPSIMSIYGAEASGDVLGGTTAAQDYYNRTHPGKGGGPTKGFPIGYTPPDQESGGDPNQPLIDAINAAAEQAAKLAEEQRIRDEELKRLEEERINLEKGLLQDSRNAYNVSQSQYSVLAQAITDVVSGRLGQGLGLGLAGLRSPAGSVARA